MSYGLRQLAPIIYNPRRTLNLYCDMILEMQNRAVRRDGGDIDAAAKLLEVPPVHFKNFAGPVLLTMITPAYNKILENYWKTEDLRTALQERLQA